MMAQPFRVRIEVPNTNGIFVAADIASYGDIVEKIKKCKLFKDDVTRCIFTYLDEEEYTISINSDEEVEYAHQNQTLNCIFF